MHISQYMLYYAPKRKFNQAISHLMKVYSLEDLRVVTASDTIEGQIVHTVFVTAINEDAARQTAYEDNYDTKWFDKERTTCQEIDTTISQVLASVSC